jgi:hypothetical protein
MRFTAQHIACRGSVGSELQGADSWTVVMEPLGNMHCALDTAAMESSGSSKLPAMEVRIVRA